MTISIQDLAKLVTEMRDLNIERARIDRELDDIFFNEHKVETVESPVLGVEPEQIHLGRVPVTIDYIEGMFEAYPVCSVIPLGGGVKAQLEGERVERFLNAVPRQAERESGEDTYGLTRQEVLRFGRSFEVCLRADSAWEEYPKPENHKSTKAYNKATEDYKRQAPLPIVIKNVPICPSSEGISAMPVLSGSKLIGFIQIHKLTVGEVLDRFGKEGQGRRPENLTPLRMSMGEAEGRKITDLVTVVEYHDKETCIYALMDGDMQGIVREYPHKMKCMPVIGYDGILSNSYDPARRWKAVYQDGRDVVKAEDRLASRQMTNVRINYYKSYFAIPEESTGEGGGEPIEFKPGQLTILHGVKDFGAVNTETASQEAQLLEAKFERMLERHLLPAALMGQQGAADEPAWGTNLRIRQAERRFKQIGTHLSKGRAELFRTILMAVISIGERVYAVDDDDEEWSITPDEAKRYLNRIRVKIEPKTIPDLNADVQAAQGLDGLKVPRRAIFEDVLGYEQPIEMMTERILEDLQFDKESPLYQQTVDLIIRRAAISREAEDAATQSDIEAAMPDVGPGAAEALMAALGMSAGAGGIPLGTAVQPAPTPPFVSSETPALSPTQQVQMKTGRQQGRQPRAKALPGRPPRYKPE